MSWTTLDALLLARAASWVMPPVALLLSTHMETAIKRHRTVIVRCVVACCFGLCEVWTARRFRLWHPNDMWHSEGARALKKRAQLCDCCGLCVDLVPPLRTGRLRTVGWRLCTDS